MVVSFLSTFSYFFIVKTTETRDVYASQKSPFGCMLFNNFNIYLLRCFKGATNLCYTYVPRF